MLGDTPNTTQSNTPNITQSNTQCNIYSNNVFWVLLWCLVSCFAPLWTIQTGLLATTGETPASGMRAPLVRMLEPDSRFSLPQQRLPKGVLPHIFRRGTVPTPEVVWYDVPRATAVLPTLKLFVVFSRWSLEGG